MGLLLGITRTLSEPCMLPLSTRPFLALLHAPDTQVLAASGTELQVVRGEAGGQPQLGPLVDMAVYSK